MLRSFPAGRTHRLVCPADGRHGSYRQSACPSSIIYCLWVDWGGVHHAGNDCRAHRMRSAIVGILVAGLIQAVMQSFGSWKPMGTLKVVLVLLWMIALAIGIVLVLSRFLS